MEDAYFIKTKRQQNEKQTVVVKFTSKMQKEKLMGAKPKLNERVFCKKSDISKQILIRCEDDVDTLLLNATTNKHWARRSIVQNREVAEEVALDDDGEDEARFVSP